MVALVCSQFVIMHTGILICVIVLSTSIASRVDTLVFAPWVSSSQSDLFEAALHCLNEVTRREFFSVEREQDLFSFLEEAEKADFSSASSEDKFNWILAYCQQHYNADTCELLRVSLKTRYLSPFLANSVASSSPKSR